MRRILATGLAAMLALGLFAGASQARGKPDKDRVLCLESFGGGDPETSIPACTRLLRKVARSDQARIYAMRGNWHSVQDAHDKAIADYNAALRLDGTLRDAWIARARSQQAKKDFAAGIAGLTEYLGFASDDRDAFEVRAQLYADLHDWDRAIADLNEVIRLGNRTDQIYILRGSYWVEKKDFTRAIVDYTEASRVNPKNQTAYEFRARVHEKDGNLKAALADFRTAFAVDPQTGEMSGIKRNIARLERDIASGFRVLPEPQKPTLVKPSDNPDPAVRPALNERRVALVIGNGAYVNAGRLPNPTSDAAALAAKLRQLGFAVVELRRDLPRDAFLDALKSFAGIASGADWAVVYFAGHGIEIGGTNYLLPVDAKVASDRDIAFEGIQLDYVLRAVEGATKLRLVLLDACRDNPFAAKMTRSVATRSVGRGLAAIEPDGGTLVAYAAKHGQIALDGQGTSSPFIAALIRNLDRPGLEINLLLRRVRDDVLAATDRRQEPFVYGSLPSDPFYFRPQ